MPDFHSCYLPIPIAVIADYKSSTMVRVEQMITKYLKLFFRLSMASSVFYVVVPGLLQYRAFRTHAVTNTTYLAPFHDM